MDDVKFVINYDFPSNIEDYVHRIGRTGRSNNKGTSYTFFTQSNGAKVDELINILQETNQVRTNIENFKYNANFLFSIYQYVNPELYGLKKFGGGNRRGGGGRNYGQQYGTFKKGAFGGQRGNSNGYGQRPYDNGGGFKSYGAGAAGGAGAGGASASTSRFSDRKFEGGDAARNGHSSYANGGHTRFGE